MQSTDLTHETSPTLRFPQSLRTGSQMEPGKKEYRQAK